ncbi:flavodoxin domain-containing protein [Mycoplasmatota bacterium WC30]
MAILIVYDTNYGNTQKVAESFKNCLKDFKVDLIKIDVLTQSQIDKVDLVILGSPTIAFNMTKKLKKALKKTDFNDKLFFVFDTRANVDDVKSKLLLKLVRRFGYAAEKMENRLIKKGGVKLIDYKYYYVKETEGPLYQEVDKQIKDDASLIITKIGELK